MVNVAVFASGSGTNFENLVMSKLTYAKVCLLIVDKEKALVIERAKRLQIPYEYVDVKAFASKVEYEKKILQCLQEYEIEFIVLAGYMRLIGKVLLDAYPKKIINIHPSYLPNFQGAFGIRDAYDAKVSETGVTIHYVDANLDSGEIIRQETLAIHPNWDFKILKKHVHDLEYKLYPEVLDTICKEGI